MELQDMKDWITPKELAEREHLSPQAIWKWVREGKLPARRIGAQIRLYDCDWNAFVAACNKK